MENKELLELSNNINDAIAQRMNNSLLIGAYLTEANKLLQGAEFVAWVEEATGLKKAQAYKWVKVYKVFGEDRRFSDVSMRVLYTLSSQSEDIIAKAARFKGRGKKLDTNALNELIAKEKKAIEKAEKAKAQDAKEPEQVEPSLDCEKQAAGSQETALEPITSENVETAPVVITDDLAIALDHIKVLEAKIEELTKPKAKATLPALPQFDSKYPAFVLGVADTQDRKEVNKAYRFFSKLYNAAQYPEIAAKLKSARDRLLAKSDCVL